jgi:hypothetical protein
LSKNFARNRLERGFGTYIKESSIRIKPVSASVLHSVPLEINAELCGNFGAAKRWKNCPTTASCYVVLLELRARLQITNVINATWIMLLTKHISSTLIPQGPTAEEKVPKETKAVTTKLANVNKYKKKSRSKYPFLA